MKHRRIYLCILLLFFVCLLAPEMAHAEDLQEEGDDMVMEGAKQKEAPQLSVYYHEYAKKDMTASPDHVNEKIRDVKAEEITNQSELFLSASSKVTIEIKDSEFEDERVNLLIEGKDSWEEAWQDCSQEYLKSSHWFGDGDDVFYLSFILKEEGHYRIRLQYEDCQGQKLTQGSFLGNEHCLLDGIYYGPTLTIDSSLPLILQLSARVQAVGERDGYLFYKENPQYELTFLEENFNKAGFQWMKKQDGVTLSSWESVYEDGKRVNKVMFQAEKDGIYQLFWRIIDASGNRQGQEMCQFSVDHSKPEIEIMPIHDDGIHSYDYREICYFSKNKILFQIQGQDPESGIASISYAYYDSEGMVQEKVVENQSFSHSFSCIASLEDDDFTGWLQASLSNNVGMSSDSVRSQSFLWESEATHESSSALTLTLSDSVYKDPQKGIAYYRDAPQILLQARDSYSGIASSHVELSMNGEEIKQEHSYGKKESISREIKEEWTGDFFGEDKHTGKYPIRISAVVEDNAGHVSSLKKTDYRIIFDDVKPEIEVKYNLNREEACYNTTRSAIVTVYDWNFKESSLVWKIKGDSKGYHMGKWQGSGNKHWCKIDFEEDGEYLLALSVEDYAGNVAGYQEKSSFIIDKSQPEIRMWMDQSDVSNGQYYSCSKKVYILIRDDNLLMENIYLYNKSRKLPVKTVKNPLELADSIAGILRRNGWKAYQFDCGKEGLYQLHCYCRDQAGNQSDEISMNPFILDLTSPVISSRHLQRNITYTDSFDAEISIEDCNLSMKECRVEVCYTDGEKVSSMEGKMLREEQDHKVVFRWKDISSRKENDNKYFLKIEACDLAGNGGKSSQWIPFYVNRYGTRYVMDQSSLKYLESYYHKKEQDIIVKAYSLLPIEEEISLNYNHGQLTLLDGSKKDYEKKVRQLSRSDQIEVEGLPKKYLGWYESTFIISGELFAREGEYNISIADREACRGEEVDFYKESENVFWMDEIQFAIDKTPPYIILSGLDQGIYKSASLDYTITARDNNRLKRVRIHVRKNGREYSWNYVEKDFNDLHSIQGQLTADNGYQYLGYEAWDYAGNYVSSYGTSAEKRVLLTENPLIQFLYGHSYGILWILCPLALLITLLLTLFILTRRGFFGILKKSTLD